MRALPCAVRLSIAVVMLLPLGCGTPPSSADVPTVGTEGPSTSSGNPAPAPSTSSGNPVPTPSTSSGNQAPSATPRPLASNGRPRTASLNIPDLGIDDLRVRPHRGTPDDATGTRIQNRGIAASPYGTGGLVGPGGIGNYVITAHRLSSTQAFLDLPDLRNGAEVYVNAGGQRYTYRIIDTRRTSFRSKRSLIAQSAAVPGRPGVRATRAMITLSTCRTPEDRAEGNSWSDEFGNPEHRIDKIGVLVSIRPA